MICKHCGCASIVIAMVSNLVAMVSNLVSSNGLQPNSNTLWKSMKRPLGPLLFCFFIMTIQMNCSRSVGRPPWEQRPVLLPAIRASHHPPHEKGQSDGRSKQRAPEAIVHISWSDTSLKTLPRRNNAFEEDLELGKLQPEWGFAGLGMCMY